MPLHILYQDISTFACDAIVAPTDAGYSGSGGTDLAIHRAAGDGLAAACRKLPPLQVGEVRQTAAFDLPCRYVFHTCGPLWQGGTDNEAVLLRSCYLNALLLSQRLQLNSIAFPLISSGSFGFPRDQVLKLAQQAISDFLACAENDIQVSLCLYDRHAYELSQADELAHFLRRPSPGLLRFSTLAADDCSAPRLDQPLRSIPRRAPESASVSGSAFGSAPRPAGSFSEDIEDMQKEALHPPSLSEWLQQQDDSFAVTLFRLIDASGMSDAQCYRKANISRQTFSKIRSDASYRPGKMTVLAFAVALELDIEAAQALLHTVGFSLSRSSTADMIIEFFLLNRNYDINEINAALFQYDQPLLGNIRE